ncbi:MAG: hypothetical protein QM796_14210 [Chthoniobacteraceae bacterium]
MELTDNLAASDPAIHQPERFVLCFGFRGVSSVLLARTAADPAMYYEEATECLSWTRLLGDKSLENGQYLAESYLHLLELKKDQACLPKS